jgi:SAM-dependent methyltransferase
MASSFDSPSRKSKMKNMIKDTQTGYDTVASEYAEKFKDEMDDKPADRGYLDRLAKEVGALGLICDMGCGPGQIARYLHRQGVPTLGVDLSPKMVEEAGRLNPEIHFHQGNMLALPDAENSWGGIAAFYSIIHIPREQIVDALRELKRVLKPGGVLLVTFHIGTEIEHLDEFFEKPVNLDFIYFQPAEMEVWLKQAGFDVIDVIVREPNPEVEYPSQRAYLFARKPVI